MLKHYGSQCKAVITDNESSLIHRYTTNCYLYEFSVGDETYTGNSLIEVGNKDKMAQWKFSGDKHKSLQVDTERTRV